MWTATLGLFWLISFVMLPMHLNGFMLPRAYLWLMGSLAIVGLTSWRSAQRPGLRNPWAAGLLLYVLAHFAWKVLWPHLWQPATLERDVIYRWPTGMFLPMLLTLGSFLAVDSWIRATDRPSQWHQVASAACWIGGLLGAYGLLQLAGLDQFLPVNWSTNGSLGSNKPITTFGQPMITANYLAILAPFCLIFKPLRYKVLWLLMSGCILLSNSQLSIGVWAVATILAFWLTSRRKLAAGFLLIGVCALWMVSQTVSLTYLISSSGRWEAWQKIWILWSQQQGYSGPITGLGLGSIDALVINHWWNWSSLHCEPYQVLIELGLIGFILMAGLLLHLGRRLLQVPPTILLAGYLAAGLAFCLIALGSFPLRVGSHLMVGCLIWACLEAHTQGVDHGLT